MNPKRLRDNAQNAGALAAVGSAVLVLGGLLAALTHGTTRTIGLALVLIGLAVLGFRVLQWLQLTWAARTEQQREEQLARLSLRGTPGLMAALSVVDAGADRLQMPVGYIARTAEQEVLERLEEAKQAALRGQGKRIVIVRGTSKAGKTRLLTETARTVLPDWTVIRPLPDHLADCLHADSFPEDVKLDRVILWLDDIEPFTRFGPGGLNAATLSVYLDEFAETPDCHVVILATCGGKGLEASVDADDASRMVSALAELEPLSHIIELDERLDASEQEAAAGVLTPLGLWDRAQVERYGLGAYLVGGPSLVAMLRTGRGSDAVTNRAGQHLAWLIAWWAHLGIVAPVTREQLEAMWQACPDPEVGPARGAIVPALAWAQTPLVSSRPAVALVCGSDGDGYWLYDYVRSRVAEAGAPPFEITRLNDVILGLVNTMQLFDVGWSAYHRDDLALAEAAWLRLLRRRKNDPLIGPLVAFGLGLILKRKGNNDAAIEMLEQVAQRGHPDAAPRASNSVAHILRDRGDVDAAKARFRSLIDCGHPEVGPSSAFDLALILEQEGDVEAAETTYRKAIDLGNPRLAARAAVNLGGLLWRKEHVESALACFETAIGYGDPEQTAKALMNIASAKRDSGDSAAVEAALTAAFDQHHPEISPAAGCRLAEVRWEQGDREGAIAALRAAGAYIHSDAGWQARLRLADLLNEIGDAAGARAEYEAVLGCGRPELIARAGLNLGELLAAAGDRDRAIASYAQSMNCKNGVSSDHAACRLATLVECQQDYVRARAGYEQALTSKDTALAAYAALRLGQLAELDQDLDAAAAAYAKAATAADPQIAAHAAACWGDVLQRTRDTDAAIPAFRLAADSGVDEIAPAASLLLGALLSGDGQESAAREALQRALDAGNSKVRKKAKELLKGIPPG